MRFLGDDGRLIIERWANRFATARHEHVAVGSIPAGVEMYGTAARGVPLVSNGFLGADMIRVPAGEGFAPHVHPGDHLLIVVSGESTVTYDGRIYRASAGEVYMVEGAVPHAVGAITDCAILAVGAPHRPVDAVDRQELVDYQAVASPIATLYCEPCGVEGTPWSLRQGGCTHAPVELETSRPLVVGLAPASERHVDLPAFWDTRSGKRLVDLLDVPIDRVDTVNLCGRYLPDWQKVPVDDWVKWGAGLLPGLDDRVVICCGRTVARALGVPKRVGWGEAALLDTGGAPALGVVIPHPSGLSRSWNDQATTAVCRRALALARYLAAVGSPRGAWDDDDVQAFTDAAHRGG